MKPPRIREDEHLALFLMPCLMIGDRLHTAVRQVRLEASDREVESVFLTTIANARKDPSAHGAVYGDDGSE